MKKHLNTIGSNGGQPVLATDNAALARNYYMGALTMLVLERTQVPVHPRSFITGGLAARGAEAGRGGRRGIPSGPGRGGVRKGVNSAD